MKILRNTWIAVIIMLICSPIVLRAEEITEQQTIVYHCHTGSSSGGGCYGKHQVGSKQEQVWVEHRQCGSSDNSCGHNNMSVNVCQQDVGPGWVTQTVNYDYWDRNCGKETNTALATFHCVKSTEEWTKELTLTASYEVSNDALKIKDEPFLWNGTASTESVYIVIDCGNYSAQLNADSNANTEAAKITFDIRNIDYTAPKVHSIIWDETPNLESTEIFIDAEDLQPDGTPGCGLHEEAYSFDGGKTWQREPSKIVRNGVFEIVVRDKLGNESRGTGNDNDNIEDSQKVVIDTVDSQAPTIVEIVSNPADFTRDAVKIIVFAEDYQDDKPNMPAGERGMGIGLHQEAYSWDNGNTWSKDNWIVVQDETIFQFMVRDKLNHQTRQEIKVENFDREDPVIQLYVDGDEENWSEGNITLKVDAKDTRSGLAEQPYSWDYGNSWGYSRKLEISESGYYEVWVRDRLGNTAKDNITVTKLKLPMEEEEEIITPSILIQQDIPKYEQPKQKPSTKNLIQDYIPPEPEEKTNLEEEMRKKETVENQIIAVTPPQKEGNIIGSTATAGMIVIFMFGIVFFLVSAGIYAKDLTGKFVAIGRSIIYPSNDGYRLNISKRQKQRAQTEVFEIHIPKFWMKGRQNAKINIYEEGIFKVTKNLQEKIEI